MNDRFSDNIKPFIPLVYLGVVALIAIGCHVLDVPKEISALLVGAGLTRVKISKP